MQASRSCWWLTVAVLAITATAAAETGKGVAVSIHLAQHTVRVGDEIPIEVTVTNLGTQPFGYSRDQLRRLDHLRFVVKDAAGAVVPAVARSPYAELSRNGPALAIAPGSSLVTTEFLGYWAKLRTPGALTVSAELDADVVVHSAPGTLAITPSSDAELSARIHALDQSLASATSYDERAAIVRKLTFIGRLGVANSLVAALYSVDVDSSMVIEAFRYYVELPRGFRDAFMSTVAQRGLAPGMRFFFAVIDPPATRAERFAIIQAALASGHDGAEQEGAELAASYPDDRYVPKLIELASGTRGARWNAIRALAFDRTDDGVACLRRVLAQADTTSQLAVTEAVKAAYLAHGAHRDGRRLAATDFPTVGESALAANSVTVEARIDARLGSAMEIYDPFWTPRDFPGSHLVISSPPQLVGKELIVIHDSGAPPTAWPVGRDVRFEISRYYFDHELNPFEGAVTGLRVR